MIHTILIKWPPTLFFRFHRVMVIFQIKWNKMEYMYNFNPAYMCCYYDITYYSDLSYKTSQDLYLFLVLPFSKFIHVISARLSETPECLFMNYSINEHYLNITHSMCIIAIDHQRSSFFLPALTKHVHKHNFIVSGMPTMYYPPRNSQLLTCLTSYQTLLRLYTRLCYAYTSIPYVQHYDHTP